MKTRSRSYYVTRSIIRAITALTFIGLILTVMYINV